MLRQLAAYWFLVLRSAFVKTRELLVTETVLKILFGLIAAILGILAHRRRWGPQAAKEQIRRYVSALKGLLLATLLFFGLVLIGTPARLYEAQRWRANNAESNASKLEAESRVMKDKLEQRRQRIHELVSLLPPAEIIPRGQYQALKTRLEQLGSKEVSITYVDDPDDRAEYPASQLVELFRSASWHAEPRGEPSGQYQGLDGLLMRVEAIDHVRPLQQAVLDAFKSAGISCGLLASQNVANRVELLVGRMRVK